MKRSLSYILGGMVMALGLSTANATVLKSSATIEITLSGIEDNNQTGIAYDPGLGLYYGGRAGNATYTGYTWSEAGGAPTSSAVMGIDIRGVWYNPNTGAIETNTFNSASGNSALGLFTVDRDGSGAWAGSGTKQTTISGIASEQSVADYDAGRDVLYSRSGNSNVVNVASHSTGALLDTITLLGMAATTQLHTIGYIDALDALVTFNHVDAVAQVFEVLTGNLLGSVDLIGLSSPASSFGMAFENSLLFVRDGTAWHGFNILASNDNDQEPPVTDVPLPAGISLFLAGLAIFGALRRRTVV